MLAFTVRLVDAVHDRDPEAPWRGYAPVRALSVLRDDAVLDAPVRRSVRRPVSPRAGHEAGRVRPSSRMAA